MNTVWMKRKKQKLESKVRQNKGTSWHSESFILTDFWLKLLLLSLHSYCIHICFCHNLTCGLSAWWLHMVTLIFLQGLCGYVWVNMLTLSPSRVSRDSHVKVKKHDPPPHICPTHTPDPYHRALYFIPSAAGTHWKACAMSHSGTMVSFLPSMSSRMYGWKQPHTSATCWASHFSWQSVSGSASTTQSPKGVGRFCSCMDNDIQVNILQHCGLYIWSKTIQKSSKI